MSPWVLRARPNPRATFRLFCFPHAGGDTWMFHDWHQALPSDVELCPIRLPGRGSRMADAPYADMRALVSALVPGLRGYLDLPFAFFGHSMGALVAFEMARELRRRLNALPSMLCVACYRAPQLARFQAPVNRLPDYLLAEELERRYGTGHQLTGNQDLMRLTMPTLRADFALCETYDYVEEPPLGCAISACGGSGDRTVDVAGLDAWEAQTEVAFLRRMFPGDHFFPTRSKAPLLEAIVEDLTWARS